MSYCQICNGEQFVATLTMPWSRFIELAIPIKIGLNSHDIAAQDFMKKVRQTPCPICSVPKRVPIVDLDTKKIVETVEKEDSNEDNRKDG